jgi:hypothetical protein
MMIIIDLDWLPLTPYRWSGIGIHLDVARSRLEKCFQRDWAGFDPFLITTFVDHVILPDIPD